MADKSAKFMSSANGLVPSTIFDRVNDMDVSEEMEEIRELLYELIKKNFPMGVSATHLADKYREEFVKKGLGRELPDDWIQQVTAAEEFEAQTRGPITILFVRLSNTSSFKRPPISSVNVRVISADREPTADELKRAKIRKETEPLEHAKSLISFASSLKPSNMVSVVSYDSPSLFYVRCVSDDDDYEKIGSTLAELYAQETPPSPLDSRVAIYEIVAGGAYALQDSTGNWFRVIVKEPPHAGMVLCRFVDVGVREKFPVGAIRLLPPAVHPVMSLGAMARAVRLNIDEKEADMLKEKLVDFLFEDKENGEQIPRNLIMCKIDESDNVDSPCVVELSTEDGVPITELLMKPHGVVRLPAAMSLKTLVEKCSTMPSVAASSTCFFDKSVVIEVMSFTQMPKNSFPANAIFAAGPADISLRQLSLDPMPDYMYRKLKEECSLPDAQLDSPPQLGGFYAAFIDDRWERVQCVRASKIDKQAFCVYLLDVGAFQYVRKEAMRRLNTSSPFKKMLVFKCKISGIVPIAGQEVWTRESHEAVREFFEAACGEPVVVEPTSSGWSQWKQLNAPPVPVCEARLSCCGRDVGEWLVACGLALPTSAAAASPSQYSAFPAATRMLTAPIDQHL